MSSLWWSFILLGFAMLVIVVEMFVPSAGVLAVVATILVVSSIVMAFMHSLLAGTLVLTGSALLIPALLMTLVKVWPSTPIGRRIMLGPPRREDVMPDESSVRELKELTGRRGIAATPMLPSGIVRIDQKNYDAVCDGFSVEKGQEVRVVAVRFNRLYVLPFDPAEDLQTDFSSELLEKPAAEFEFDGLDDSRPAGA